MLQPQLVRVMAPLRGIEVCREGAEPAALEVRLRGDRQQSVRIVDTAGGAELAEFSHLPATQNDCGDSVCAITWSIPQATGCFRIEGRHRAAGEAWRESDCALAGTRVVLDDGAALVSLRGLRVQALHPPCKKRSLRDEIKALPNREPAAKPSQKPPPVVLKPVPQSTTINLAMVKLPQFPWPPPPASASHKLARGLLVPDGTDATLGQVADRLEQALNSRNYAEHRYFSVPGGYALATRLEQIEEDGRSKPPPERWEGAVKPLRLLDFDLREYIDALFGARKGWFRIIVFVVTPEAFGQGGESVSKEEAMSWLTTGSLKLPAETRNQAYSEAHDCIALIYEFETDGPGAAAQTSLPSHLSGLDHLQGALLLQTLSGRLP